MARDREGKKKLWRKVAMEWPNPAGYKGWTLGFEGQTYEGRDGLLARRPEVETLVPVAAGHDGCLQCLSTEVAFSTTILVARALLEVTGNPSSSLHLGGSCEISVVALHSVHNESETRPKCSSTHSPLWDLPQPSPLTACCPVSQLLCFL